MKIEKISQEELKKELAKPRRGKAGSWKDVIAEVIKTGEAVKITDITRGSVSAGFRAAKDSGLRFIANYKENTLVIAPAEPKAEPKTAEPKFKSKA